MNTEKKDPDQILDEVIAGIRAEEVTDAQVEGASARAWAKVSQAFEARETGGVLRTCADFQTLMPAFLSKQLSDAQRWLLEDHVHACSGCRNALEAARTGKVVSFEPRRSRTPWFTVPQWKWAMAAALAVGVGIGAWQMRDNLLPAPGGSRGVVQSVEGGLYRVSDTGTVPVYAGAELSEREGIRTARGAHAMVRLADGSLVEMRERSELSLSRKRSGTTIRLERGSVIVQAAKQRTGRLYVATNDCLISVKGTIFAVDRGTKGSRVAVIEGVVQVDEARETKMLHPGQQASTGTAMAAVPIKEEIAWSENLNQYLALLGEFAVIQKELAATPGPGLRYSSRLLDLVPAGTVLYAAIPNVGGMLGDAQRILQERLDQSAVLRNWWNSIESPDKIKQALDTVRGFSEYLANEVVLTVSEDGSGQYRPPVVMAQVTRPGFQEYLTQQMSLLTGQGNTPDLVIVQDPSALPASSGAQNKAFVLIMNDVVAVSPDPDNLRAVAASIQQPGSSAFRTTAFYQRIADTYSAGTEWLIAADMEQILVYSVNEGKRHGRERHAEMQSAETQKTMFSQLGVMDARHLLVERREVGGKTENRAVLTFAQPRRGIASWLAAPAPMGSLDFVSPEASFVTAFVVKQPRAAVEELFSALQSVDSNFTSGQAEFESHFGLSVLDDLAGPLGGEVAFALDGPMLPTPSWKFAIEVYDPARLEHTIEALISRAAEHADGAGLRLTPEPSGGRTDYVLRAAQTPFEIHYTFTDGYLVAASNKALLDRAIEQRRSGYSLARSASFKALLSPDGYSNFSAILYQNLAPVLGPVADRLRASGNLSAEQQRSIEALKANAAPTLVYAYGGPDRIELASTGSFFGLNLDTLAAGGGPFQVPALLGRSAHMQPSQ